MDNQRASKITISLPESLLNLADHLAHEWETTRSGVFAGLLKKEEEAKIKTLMAKGYLELGEENRLEAEEALNLTSEVVLRSD